MIDLSAEQLEEVKTILKREIPNYVVWCFGSRVDGSAKEFSDLDLVIVEKEIIDWRLIEKLKDAFSSSDLSFQVDVLDWQSISDEFRSIIKKKYVVIQ
jgi:uncharacterized protein